MNTWMSIRFPLGLLAVSALLLGGACDDAQDYNPTDSNVDYRIGARSKAATLASFGSCEDVQSYAIDRYTDFVVDQYAYYGPWRGGVDFAVDFAVPETGQDAGAPTNDGGEEPGEFTDTNVQEAGVDEADVVKTNGNHIYYIQGQTLRVMQSFPPADTALLAELTVEGHQGKLYLDGDQLFVITQEYDNSYYYPYYQGEDGTNCFDGPSSSGQDDQGAPEQNNCDPKEVGPLGAGPTTRVTVYDVANPSSPTLTSTVLVQGNLVDTRRIEDAVYLVTRRDIQWNYEVFERVELTEAQQTELRDAYMIEEAHKQAEALDAIKFKLRPIVADAVSEIDLTEALRTRYLVGDGDPQLLIDCTDLMRPSIDSESMSVLNVIGFRTNEPEALDGVALVSSGWHVYSSQNALYVARDSRGWDWWGSEQPEALTHIHKFLLDDANVSYAASGSVSGFVKDRYSFSEFRGFLRVATTDQEMFWWGGPVSVDGDTVSTPDRDEGSQSSEGDSTDPGTDGRSPVIPTSPPVVAQSNKQSQEQPPPVQANNLYVLEENGEELSVVGSVSGYGENERIYAVRFMGERAYIVTFRQTDPLYTLDLSDPENPSIAGELKITGFSNYLHPIGDDYMIGLGREATEDGRITGLQVQLFDVSDDENPTRISQYVVDFGDGWAWSNADHDPHAFVWYPRRNLLSIPLTVENWTEAGYSSFAGLALFHITPEDGVTAAGRVSHNDFVSEAYCEGPTGVEPRGDEIQPECYDTYISNAQMQRSIFINDPDDPEDENDSAGDFLYAISVLGLSVSNADEPEKLLTRIQF